MELWNRARGFAEEAAKRSQATKFTEIIAETTKEIAAQASRYLPQPSIINGVYLHRFGITQELREFVEGITITTFEDFPLQDDTELSDVPAVSNVRQDLTEWQEKHARLVLSTVKFIFANSLSGFSDDGDGGYDDDLDKLMDNSRIVKEKKRESERKQRISWDPASIVVKD
ncbi:hypothetical protein JHK85_047378 [Glycine max]|nr:hypothetical protein JHK85_047378 [Glycine max]